MSDAIDTPSAAPVDTAEAPAPEAVAEPTEVAGEAAVAPASAPAPVDDGPLGPRFSALARREKELTLRERTLKESTAKRDAEITERLAKAEAFESKRKGWTDDPLALLSELGITYQDLTERVLKHGEPPTAEDRVARLEARLEAEAKAREEAAAKAEADAKAMSAKQVEDSISAFKSSIRDYVKASADTYEMIAAEDAHELVFDLIEAGYQENGSVMPVEQAAEIVEAHLLEDVVARLQKSKKLAARLAPPVAVAPAQTFASKLPIVPKGAAKSPTLTNKLASAETSVPVEKKPMLTAREIAEIHVRQRRARNARA